MIKSYKLFFSLLISLPLTGCFITDVKAPTHVSLGLDGRPGASTISASDAEKIAQLQKDLKALGSGTSKAEAREIAHDAVLYPWFIVEKWDVQSPPQYQNILVNQGKRPAGLCWQWADAMTALMKKKNLQTFDLHRGVSGRYTKDEHNVLVLTAKGGDFYEGILLDPWRDSGSLHWSKIKEEVNPSLYQWAPFYSLPRDKRGRRQIYSPQVRGVISAPSL